MILECCNLIKDFSDGRLSIRVLENINLNVAKGGSIAIIGPSGSGKSTLLHILAGLDMPTKGEIKISGKSIFEYSEKDRCRLRNERFGFVYQYHHLLKDFTVIENIMMPLLIKRESFKSAHKKAMSLLKDVSLEKRSEFSVGKLSGGEKQRVAILRALINKPDILFADEPTGNLCKSTAEQVYNSLLELKEKVGTSVIVVTHDMSLANKMDKKYLLHDGVLTLQPLQQ